MSGFEVVGVVLAVLPMIISALERYGDCLEEYSRYESTVRNLQIRLRLEQEIFQDTIKRLLLNQLSQLEVENLFPEESGHLDAAVPAASWASADVQKKLKTGLGSKHGAFLDDMKVMRETVEALMDKLDIDFQGRPRWQTKTPNTTQQTAQRPTGLRWEWTKIRHSFGSKKREKLLKTFQEHNASIGRWVENKEILSAEPLPEAQAQTFISYFDLVRTHACRLHAILQKGWSCNCRAPHDGNLQLDQRLDQRDVLRPVPSFRVSFSFYSTPEPTKNEIQRHWKETEIEVEELDQEGLARFRSEQLAVRALTGFNLNEEAPTKNIPVPINYSRPRVKFHDSVNVPDPDHSLSTKLVQPDVAFLPIKSLCHAIRNIQESEQYVGSIPDTTSQRIARVRAASKTKTHGYQDTTAIPHFLPLNALLRSQKTAPGTTTEYGQLSRKQRLGLAVALASAVLQLYDSPWMGEVWDKKDICFFSHGLDGNNCPLISSPYVSRSFPPPNPSITASPTSSNITPTPFVINKTLFALGIVLVELCLNRPFEDLRDAAHSETSNNTPNILDDYQIANNAISEVYREGGDQYGYVVQRCLRCEFQGQDCQKKLDNHRFRTFVYEGVLEHLKADYNQFSLYST